MNDLSKLGPLWVKDLVHRVQSTRNCYAENLLLLKPDGDYAKQHQMVLDVADRMLAAAANPRDAEIAALVAENEALHEKLARKDEACNSTINAALMMPDPVRQAEPERMDTDESREYLVKFMEQHFTDTTFHRYIRGQISGSAPLAGDFAWQMARALRMLPAANPAAVGAGDQKPVAWLRFWARQSYSGRGDIDYGEGLEVCMEGERGDDGVAAFPVYGSPTTNGAAGAP
jgi:hypothetical protein